MVQFDPASEADKVEKHVSAHKGKYPDELIDHYSVGYTVGDGGFSKVKLARHRMTGIKVAIKMISKETLLRQNELFRAANEIAALQLLKHQNIARLFQGVYESLVNTGKNNNSNSSSRNKPQAHTHSYSHHSSLCLFLSQPRSDCPNSAGVKITSVPCDGAPACGRAV